MMLFIPVVVFEERRGASLVGNRASSLKVTRSVASGRRLEGGILGATLKHFEVIRLLCPFQNLLEVPYHNPNIFPLKLTRVGGGRGSTFKDNSKYSIHMLEQLYMARIDWTISKDCSSLLLMYIPNLKEIPCDPQHLS